MADVLQILAQQTLPSTLTTVYTVPAGMTGIITTMSFCNTDSTNTASISMYFVPSGGLASAANQIFTNLANGLNVLPGETVIVNPGHYLAAGATIQIQASNVNLVGCTISGDVQG